jgi:hypothetical protein
MESSRGSSSEKSGSRDRRPTLQDHEREIAALKREVASLTHSENAEERFEHRLERTAHELEEVVTEAREIAQLTARLQTGSPQADHSEQEPQAPRELERVEALVRRLHTELEAVARALREREEPEDRGLL